MPYPDIEVVNNFTNRLIVEELQYGKDSCKKEFEDLFPKLTDEQLHVYNQIINAVEHNSGSMLFLYGYGGTGKTFLWKTLSSSIRSKGEIVLNVASSGIASLLLTGGRIAHSRFHIPLVLNEDSLCYIKPNSDVANLLKKTKLIIWDEAPMAKKYAFEALDRSMKNIFSNEDNTNLNLPFGGKVIVFGGDFRQILPVVRNRTRQGIVNASLCSSVLWRNCKILKLTKNLRLLTGSDPSHIQETKEFADWLLDIGEGNVGDYNDGRSIIDIPNDLIISNCNDPVYSLVEFVYPNILENYNDISYFKDIAILAPTNEVVHEINDRLIGLFQGQEKEYLSFDTINPSESLKDDFDPNLYSHDVLNGIKSTGLPNHKLTLKVGVQIMLLQNTDQKSGLCNGTRLIVVALGNRVIEAQVLTDSIVGLCISISRMSMTPDEDKILFKFRRRHFPISFSFAMTVNKSQGQSLSWVGLFLKEPIFSHGQLYVALSRVTNRVGLKLCILDKESRLTNKTSNVVYKEIFSNL